MKIHLIAAARPNFMKIAPLYHELIKSTSHKVFIVHTGQHFDKNMSDQFFEDLKLPKPHIYLGVGGGSHAHNVGNTMIKYEEVCNQNKPDLVIVVGDVNATMACSITAKKLGIKVAHLEAGIRSFDMSMPEEINRKVTDSIVDYFWTPSIDGNENLIKEGIEESKIKLVGNIMIDSFEMMKQEIISKDTYKKYNLEIKNYCVVTLHRPSNVDKQETLKILVKNLKNLSNQIKIVFPIHPRTKMNLEKFGLLKELKSMTNLHIVEPLGYTKFMNLVLNSKFVLTDSGGIQEETTYLKIPCITLRNNTERPITVTIGSNTLSDISTLSTNLDLIFNDNYKQSEIPYLWDGKTASRVIEEINKIGDEE